MPKRYIETVVKLDGEAEYKKALSNINGELKTLGSESKLIQAEFKGQANSMEALEAKGDNLRKKLKEQSEAVEILEEALSKSKDAYGDHAKETQAWQQKLNRAKASLIDLEGELKDNDKYLDEAKKSTDRCAKSIDGFGKEVKDAEKELGGFEDIVKSALGDAGLGGLGDMLGKGLAVGAVVGGVKELGEAIISVVEETEEYRRIMGTLETSSAAAGYTAEETAETFNLLYGVLGDTQTAATAAANLQALGLEQETLTRLVNGAIGAWATYGDSIPIDGLTEAINETAQTGKVTGVLADVLNWAGISEDQFNARLETSNDTTARANMITKMLAQQGLTATAEAWKENNQDIIAMNQSEANLEAAMGRLGTILTPVAGFLKNTLAFSINAVADAMEEAVRWAKDFINWMKKAGDAPAPTGKAADAGYNGSHAGGLARVPFDNYRAILHKDEMVLPAEESETLRRWFSGSVSAFTAQRASAYTPRAENRLSEQLQPVTIIVQSLLDGDKVAETVTRAQIRMKRTGGMA